VNEGGRGGRRGGGGWCNIIASLPVLSCEIIQRLAIALERNVLYELLALASGMSLYIHTTVLHLQFLLSGPTQLQGN